jgi:hypothetical protein
LATVLAVPRSPHVAKLVRFPPEVYERLAAVARRERRSVTAQVVRFVEEGLARLARRERDGSDALEEREYPRVAEDGEGGYTPRDGG